MHSWDCIIDIFSKKYTSCAVFYNKSQQTGYELQ